MKIFSIPAYNLSQNSDVNFGKCSTPSQIRRAEGYVLTHAEKEAKRFSGLFGLANISHRIKLGTPIPRPGYFSLEDELRPAAQELGLFA